MFICRDASHQYLVSAYWENAELVVVAKEERDDGELVQKLAVRYSRSELTGVLDLLESQTFCCDDICLDAHAIAGLVHFISAGRRRSRLMDLRVTPDMLN
ncbi:MAG: hypothetical protein NXI04_28455 [Planctomycetaceae bacterium]|nr:hypothetical protein [Planctomycetaceae bacterium]